MQAAEDRYLEVYAGELEEFTIAGDMRGWYGHLWKLQVKDMGSAQYIRDEDGKLKRKLEGIRDKWRQYFTSLLNTTSAALNQAIVESLLPKPVRSVTRRPADCG